MSLFTRAVLSGQLIPHSLCDGEEGANPGGRCSLHFGLHSFC